MKITKALRDHMVSKHGVAADATDEVVRAAVMKALGDATLDAAKYAELSAEVDPKKAATDLINATVQPMLAPVNAALAELLATVKGNTAGADAAAKAKADADAAAAAAKSGQLFDLEKLRAEITASVSADLQKKIGNDGANTMPSSKQILMMGLTADANDAPNVKVKAHVERFAHAPTAAVYKNGPQKGRPIVYEGRNIDVPTERLKAMWGAWFKWQVFPEHLTDQDSAIINHILHTEKFYVDPFKPEARKLTEHEIFEMKAFGGANTKAPLINDSTSGGQYAVPEFFDTVAIILPVLEMEVSPLVDMMDVPRGSAAQGFTMGNPTFAAANAEGTGVSLFDATSFIGNHDTTFFRAAGATQIGLNWLEDAVPGMVDQLLQGYTRKSNEWLDEQILVGDGTTEPQGIMNASGTIDVTSATPTTGPLTVADAINLLFAVTKPFRTAYDRSSVAYASTETTYKRFRSIATGVTGDSRLLFGMDLEDYQLFGHKFAVNASGMANDQVVFGQFKGYKLYRRQGLRFRRETAGSTLALANTMLVLGDMLYGGQVKRGNYFAVMTSAPT